MKKFSLVLIILLLLLCISWFVPVIPYSYQVECIQAPCPPVTGFMTLKQLTEIEKPSSVIIENNSTNKNEETNIPSDNNTEEFVAMPSTKNDDCTKYVGYSCDAYKDGWKDLFKKENKLSELDFNKYITIDSVVMSPVGNTYELRVDYRIKKDWVSVIRQDSMTLLFGPYLKPNELPIENNNVTQGRIGVSSIELNKPFVFSNSNSVVNYFIEKYGIKNNNIKFDKVDFEYFWNVEKDGLSVAGGGEPYAVVRGVVDEKENKCFYGVVSLLDKKTSLNDTPCRIY